MGFKYLSCVTGVLLLTGLQSHFVESCQKVPVDLIEFGLWPLSTKSYIYITFELMMFLSSLTNFSPTTSMTAITNALNFNTQWNCAEVVIHIVG